MHSPSFFLLQESEVSLSTYSTALGFLVHLARMSTRVSGFLDMEPDRLFRDGAAATVWEQCRMRLSPVPRTDGREQVGTFVGMWDVRNKTATREFCRL